MKIVYSTCLVAFTMCLLAVRSASAQPIPGKPPAGFENFSDVLWVVDPAGNVREAVGVTEDDENAGIVTRSLSVPIDPSQFGNYTLLTEGPGSNVISDVFGIKDTGNGLLLSFDSDDDAGHYGGPTSGSIVYPELPGVIYDATMYLEPGLRTEGFRAFFVSDGEGVPTPAAAPGAAALGLALIFRRKIASLFKKA